MSPDQPSILQDQEPLKRELYSTTIPVMVNHLNYGNHLGYDSVLTILHEARMRWLKANAMSEPSIDGDVGYIITKASVSYHGEGFYGDQLQVQIYADSLHRKGFKLSYRVTNEASGKLIAEAETGHLFFDYTRRAVALCPESFNRIMADSGAK